uniref:TIL domain-containing protein n=1 Tax=Rhabditophanes sp. KR3021 TaxID=114890 RepID=A0AC35U4F9_9BILA
MLSNVQEIKLILIAEAKCLDKEPMMCTLNCRSSGCYCLDPNVLDDNGNCINKKDCPVKVPECLKNYAYMECGPGCANICGRRYFWCDPKCGKPGCYCSGLYSLIKENGGKCVLTTSCPVVKPKKGFPLFPSNDSVKSTIKPQICPINEVYMECGSGCKSQCGLYNKFCPDICNPRGCYCTGEYATDKQNGNCILRTSCLQFKIAQ